MLLVIRGGIRNLFGIWASKLGGGREFCCKSQMVMSVGLLWLARLGLSCICCSVELHLKKNKQKNKTKLQKALQANPGSEGPTSAQVGVLGHLE